MRAFEGREGVHVERHRMVDDLVEDRSSLSYDLAVPPRAGLSRACRSIPPKLTVRRAITASYRTGFARALILVGATG